MNWAWASSIEQLWRSPSFPIWVTMAAAGFFGVVVLVALLRAEKSVANAALAMIALLAIGAAATVFLRNGPIETAVGRAGPAGEAAAPIQQSALACVDDLAGDTVLAACERLLFGSPDTVAAAVSYTSGRINRLLAAGDVAAADRALTPDLERLRRSIERDRYGLVAYVLATRDHCQPGDCAAYRSLTDHNQIAANMDERVYEAQVQRYSPGWTAGASPAAAAPGPAPVAALAPSVPTGKPTNAEFPTSASIPPVNIMTPEPPLGAAPAAPKPAATAPAAAKPAPAAAAKPAAPAAPAKPAAAHSAPAAPTPTAANAQAAASAAKKPPPPPKPKPPVQAPVQLAPAAATAED